MVTKLVLVPQPKYILFYAQGPLGRILLHAGAAQKGQKCGLKYVIHISGGPVWTSVEHTYTEQWNYAGMISICGVFLNIRN